MVDPLLRRGPGPNIVGQRRLERPESAATFHAVDKQAWTGSRPVASPYCRQLSLNQLAFGNGRAFERPLAKCFYPIGPLPVP